MNRPTSYKRRSTSSACLFSIYLFLITSTTAGMLIAQTGQNAVIKNTSGQTINSPSFFDATQFGIAGNDPCQRILATFNDPSFPSTGGTVDARGLISGTNTTLTCSVNPIPSTAKGRLLLSSGTYLAQMPWVIQSYDVNLIGTGGGIDTGNTNTTIQACVSGQGNCGGKVFPSGQAVVEVGPLAGGGNSPLFQVTVKELNIDCQDAPGASGLSVIAGQEETVFDQVRASGCRIAGFDIGRGDTQDQNGAALSNFQVKYPGGNGCPTVTPGNIATVSRDVNGVVTVQATTGSFSPPLEVGYEVVIAGVLDGSFNGTYRVNGVTTTPPPPVFTYQENPGAGTGTSTGGTFSLFPVGVRVWQKSGSPVRPIINGTINGAGCSSPPPIAMELSGGFPLVHSVHTEGFDVGVQIGDLSGTSGATLINLMLENKTKTGVLISNQWITSGAPGPLPTANINILNLDVTGGTPQTTNSIIDNINGNTLTQAAGNGAVGYYLYGLNGVMTSAKPQGTLLNAFDISGQTAAIYSGSSTPVFSAGPSSAGTGVVSTAHYLGVQATGPTCAFTTGGGGLGAGCALDTGSTDSVGTIIATTGTSPSSSGTITLTFNSSLGTNRPSCVFTASDGGTAWAASVVMKDKTPLLGSDVFTWTNGTTALTPSKAYWINYFCAGR